MSENFIGVLSFQEAKIKADIAMMVKQGKNYEMATRLVYSELAACKGKVICEINGDIYFQLPVDEADALKIICQRLKDEERMWSRIGVGESVTQAEEAHEHLVFTEDFGIKVYEFKEIRKDEEPLVKADEDQWLNLDGSSTQKILQFLSVLKQNQPVIQQIAQMNPEIYQGIIGVVTSLSQIIELDKQSKDKHLDKTANEINQHIEELYKKHHERKASEISRTLRNLQAEDRGVFINEGDHFDDFNEDNDSDGEPNSSSNDTSAEKSEKDSISLQKDEGNLSSKIIQSVMMIESNVDFLKELQQQNPDLATSIDQLVLSLAKIYEAKTGKNLEQEVANIKAQDPNQPQEEKPQSIEATPADAPSSAKTTYPPGSVRNYDNNKQSVKGSDNQWHSAKSAPR